MSRNLRSAEARDDAAVALVPAAPETPVPVDAPSAGAIAGAGADYNLRILWSPARYIEDTFGRAELEKIAKACGLDAAHFDGSSRWASLEAFERFLVELRARVEDDAAFKSAVTYRFEDAYGAFRFVLWAASPSLVYEQSVKHYRLICTVDDVITRKLTRTYWHFSVRSTRPLSRLNCLLRQAQSSQLPALWGLPPAQIEEESCIAHGDPSCEIHYRWYEAKRWYPIVGATLGGMLLGYLIGATSRLWTSIFLAIIGALVAYVLEVGRTDRVNSGTRAEFIRALERVAREEAEARREIMDLHHRQRHWSRALEASAAERSSAIREIVERVERMQQERETTLRGFSHDLRNPLTVIQSAADYFRPKDEDVAQDPAETAEVIEDLDNAIGRMRRMLAELMQVATSQDALMRLVPQRIGISDLADRMRRRLRALVHGRDIRVLVTCKREVPEVLNIDPLLLDRVIDNLFTNAAKYTERGSITVDVDGDASEVILKVADTGRGIAPEDIERTFHAGGSDAARRANDSYGVGLSVVVQLLDQIGGRLDVMSKLGVGTTFWVRLPTRARASVAPPPPEVAEKKTRSVFSRVVRVRNYPA